MLAMARYDASHFTCLQSVQTFEIMGTHTHKSRTPHRSWGTHAHDRHTHSYEPWTHALIAGTTHTKLGNTYKIADTHAYTYKSTHTNHGHMPTPTQIDDRHTKSKTHYTNEHIHTFNGHIYRTTCKGMITPGLLRGPDPARGSGQEVPKNARIEVGWVKR